MQHVNPTFASIYLFVRDMPASLAFYRRIGLSIPAEADSQTNVEVTTANGFALGFGTLGLTHAYDTGFLDPSGPSQNSLQFSMPSRQSVDDIHAELVVEGYTSHLLPIDAFWGSRYAIIEDPDGNIVGFQSPADDAHRGAPPGAALGG